MWVICGHIFDSVICVLHNIFLGVTSFASGFPCWLLSMVFEKTGFSCCAFSWWCFNVVICSFKNRWVCVCVSSPPPESTGGCVWENTAAGTEDWKVYRPDADSQRTKASGERYFSSPPTLTHILMITDMLCGHMLALSMWILKMSIKAEKSNKTTHFLSWNQQMIGILAW